MDMQKILAAKTAASKNKITLSSAVKGPEGATKKASELVSRVFAIFQSHVERALESVLVGYYEGEGLDLSKLGLKVTELMGMDALARVDDKPLRSAIRMIQSNAMANDSPHLVARKALGGNRSERVYFVLPNLGKLPVEVGSVIEEAFLGLSDDRFSVCIPYKGILNPQPSETLFKTVDAIKFTSRHKAKQPASKK